MKFTVQITLFIIVSEHNSWPRQYQYNVFEGFGIREKEQHRAKTKKYPWNALHGWIQPWRR